MIYAVTIAHQAILANDQAIQDQIDILEQDESDDDVAIVPDMNGFYYPGMVGDSH